MVKECFASTRCQQQTGSELLPDRSLMVIDNPIMTDTMTHDEIQKARVTLGLSVADMAKMLGHDPVQQRRLESAPEVNMHREARPTTVRLLQAFLDGYRPADWPEQSKPGLAAKR